MPLACRTHLDDDCWSVCNFLPGQVNETVKWGDFQDPRNPNNCLRLSVGREYLAGALVALSVRVRKLHDSKAPAWCKNYVGTRPTNSDDNAMNSRLTGNYQVAGTLDAKKD